MEDQSKAGPSETRPGAVPESSAGATEAESAPPADRGPDATKEELGTDLSDIARARLSG